MNELADSMNETLFREKNERLEPFNASSHWVNPPFADWFCECANEDYDGPVQLTVAEYETIRADPTHFFVAPSDGHVVSEVEQVIERRERYLVVEKSGRAAEVSEALTRVLKNRSRPKEPERLQAVIH